MFEFSAEANDFFTPTDVETTPVSSHDPQKGSQSFSSSRSHISHPNNSIELSQILSVSGFANHPVQHEPEGLQTEIDIALIQWLNEQPFGINLSSPFDLDSANDLGVKVESPASTYVSTFRSSIVGVESTHTMNDLNAFAQEGFPMANQCISTLYTESPIPALSPSPVPSTTSFNSTSEFSSSSLVQPASQPQVISKFERATGTKRTLTKRGVPVKARCQYDVNFIYEFMWENVAMSENSVAHSGPGKHGVKILDHFGNLEAAKAHLADSKMARKLASRKGISPIQARRQRDKRRDFFCFMPGCGLCFERADKLERHLIETNVHGTIKPVICPHRSCRKTFVDIITFVTHADNHSSAGHGDCLIPYPWNCPYPAVVEGLWRAFEALPTLLENDAPEV